jgi:hypothetical protein
MTVGSRYPLLRRAPICAFAGCAGGVLAVSRRNRQTDPA